MFKVKSTDSTRNSPLYSWVLLLPQSFHSQTLACDDITAAPLLLIRALVEVTHDRARMNQSRVLTRFHNALYVREGRRHGGRERGRDREQFWGVEVKLLHLSRPTRCSTVTAAAENHNVHPPSLQVKNPPGSQKHAWWTKVVKSQKLKYQTQFRGTFTFYLIFSRASTPEYQFLERWT